MKVYAISDLHLALSISKPMDIFGDRWTDYMNKIQTHWREIIREEDTVILPGDISWATYMEEALEDFMYIDRLPGKKIISKGNHDYWWSTQSKLQKFLLEHNFTSIQFMHNNSFDLGSFVVCGTRGWDCPADDNFSAEDRKIYLRELQRLEISLQTALQYDKDILVALHYPPFSSRKQVSGFVDILHKYGVKKCIYGHLHGEGFRNAVEGIRDGIEYHLVSADYLNFRPFLL